MSYNNSSFERRGRSRSRSPVGSRGGGGGGGSANAARLSTRRLHMSNLPFECDWKQLKDLVKDEVGEECFVDIAFDRRGKSLGFGFVECFNVVDVV